MRSACVRFFPWEHVERHCPTTTIAISKAARRHKLTIANTGYDQWDFSRLPRLQFLSAHPLPSGMGTALSGAKRGPISASPASQLAEWTGLARGDIHARRPPQLRQGMHWSGYSAGRRASATPVMLSCGLQRCGGRQMGRATAASLPVAGCQMVETLLKQCS